MVRENIIIFLLISGIQLGVGFLLINIMVLNFGVGFFTNTLCLPLFCSCQLGGGFVTHPTREGPVLRSSLNV